VLIASKLLIMIAFALLLSVELVHGWLFYSFFLLYKLLMGIAMGGGGMARTHVAMASTEEDRNKAIGWCSLFPAIGLLISYRKNIFIMPFLSLEYSPISVINAATSFIQYPGFQIPLISIHFNLFTAPIIFAMFIFIVALYLLVFHFEGKWQNCENLEQIKQKQRNQKKFSTKGINIRINTEGLIQQEGWLKSPNHLGITYIYSM
jgi:hypothetical protein